MSELERVNASLQDVIDQIVSMAETHGYIEVDVLRGIVEGRNV